MDFFERLTDVCHALLMDNAELLDYLKRRQVTAKTIKDWRIGFVAIPSADGWRAACICAKLARSKFRKDMKKFSVIIPSWKNIALLDLVYKGLKLNSTMEHEIIVFFNE